MLGLAVAGFLLHCLLNFPCHTSINLIVQNKWANFWSRRLCLQDRSGGLLTSPNSVEASPSFDWNISSRHQWPFLLLLRSSSLFWLSSVIGFSLLSHLLPWNHRLHILISQSPCFPLVAQKRLWFPYSSLGGDYCFILASVWIHPSEVKPQVVNLQGDTQFLCRCDRDHGDNSSHSWT